LILYGADVSDRDKMMVLVWFMVFKATFNNISVISWWSVLLVEEAEVLGENHRQLSDSIKP
jgi:Na+-transporting NADH:ubiquinone oxidoreductase subunit NqrB